MSLAGTRSGNSVALTGSSGGDTITMALVWTSDDTFGGTGRIDDADSTFIEFDAEGEVTPIVTSSDGSGLLGLGE